MRTLAAVLLAGALAWGDAVRLKSGEVVVGQVVKTAPEVVVKRDDGSQVAFKAADVAQILRGDTYKTFLAKRDAAKSPEDRAALAKWCFEQELAPEGRQVGDGLLREKDSDDLRKAIGLRKLEGEWVWPDVQAAMQRAPYPKDIVWSLEWDADAKDFDEWKAWVRRSATHLWRATEGQIWLRSVKLQDKSKNGEVWVDPSGEHPLCSAGQVHLARGWFPEGQYATFLHSWGHAFLGLPDEYQGGSQASDKPTENCCAMGTSSHAGFCDDTNHTWPGASCWNRMVKRLNKLRHPNPHPADAPPVKIDVVDK